MKNSKARYLNKKGSLNVLTRQESIRHLGCIEAYLTKIGNANLLAMNRNHIWGISGIIRFDFAAGFKVRSQWTFKICCKHLTVGEKWQKFNKELTVMYMRNPFEMSDFAFMQLQGHNSHMCICSCLFELCIMQWNMISQHVSKACDHRSLVLSSKISSCQVLFF